VPKALFLAGPPLLPFFLPLLLPLMAQQNSYHSAWVV
jgi:hypothetical protein